MTWTHALLAATAYFSAAMAQTASNTTFETEDSEDDSKEFPLVWVCLGITVVGVALALYVAYRRPDEFHLPGSTVMVATETEEVGGRNEPINKKETLNDDLETV
ncbi:hypothetical protein DQ04_00761190 [Trypanosoma grayi]|uniref:hypothetical protein n=1 Tax=Trypanosoma grayi TaxID=71804 RepID=UPI0004F4AB40|nr:hypothetical protein DQ04_00761190 [Trypanosoma grayi]KEG13839.1 hypothetical protein DQ04_00761190 [Trypanosoma grayi]